jgi:putative DNA primase/helicase
MSETLNNVGKVVGAVERVEPKPEMTDEQKRKAMNNLWQSSLDPKQGDPVFTYLHRRCGIDVIPFAIRYHPKVYHAETGNELPCMVSKVTGFDNKPVALHRTYLNPDGTTAKVVPNKKLMASMPDGSAIRLNPYTDTIGIAEGIETALSCTVCFGIPTWAAVSAAGMAKWKPPEVIEKVFIFADNDHSFTGQLSAYKLAWTLEREYRGKYKIRVIAPKAMGADWNDMHNLVGRNATRDMIEL